MSTLRTWLFWLHLAAGVTAGVAIVTMSVTGALLALQPQILDWLEREQRVVSVPPGGQRLAPSALIEASGGSHSRADTVTLTMTSDPSEAALVSLGRGEIRYVDPYTGAVVGEGAATARRVFLWLTEFHRWFASAGQWRATARGVTGWSTLAFVVLITSGAILWIPRRLSRTVLIRSITPAWPATTQARYFNWHTVLGFWCAPVLLVLALSGVVLAFPWANRLLFAAAGTPQPQPAPSQEQALRSNRTAEPNAGIAAMPDARRMDEAWQLAARQLPTWRSIAMRIQTRADSPLSFTITDAAHWNRFARSQFIVARSTGAVVRWEPYSDISRGQRWRGWARFAHTGELGGLVGQVIAGVASAAAALLAWTGMSLAVRRLARSRGVKQTAARAA